MAGLLVFGVYALRKTFRKEVEPDPLLPKPPSRQNEAGFALATMQAVIADLKAQNKALAELCRSAEHRAEEAARIGEIVTREMPTAVLVFDRAGFLIQANPAARVLLAVDTWSRRRYPEILGPESTLTALVREGLESGSGRSWEPTQWRPAGGEVRALKVFLSPLSTQGAEISGVICLLATLGAT